MSIRSGRATLTAASLRRALMRLGIYRRFHWFSASLLLPILCLPLGCRRQGTTIVVLPPSTTSLLWQPFLAGVHGRAQRSGFHIAWEAAPDEDDVESQLTLLKQATDPAQRGIILVPDTTLTLRTQVLRAVSEHIPVVVVDDDFGPPAGPFLSYVSNDEKAGAELAARRLAEKLHGRGTIDIVGINPQQERSVTRDELFEQALNKAAPLVHVAQRQFGSSSVTQEQEVCRQLLGSSQPPDAIVALSAAATRGAYDASLAAKHRSATLLIGFDQGVLGPVRDGAVDAVVVQDTRALGQRAITNILAHIAGKSVPAQTLVAPMLVTKGNIDSPAVAALLGVQQTLMPDGTRHTLVPDEPDAQAFQSAAREHTTPPGIQPIGDLIRIPPQNHEVTVQGTIISLPPMLGVQDDTSALFVTSYTSDVPLKLGDVVEVHGHLVSRRFRSHLENATIRVLWADRPVPPFAVTATQLTTLYRGQSIEVEGNVLSEKMDKDRADLVLEDDDQVFRALVYAPVAHFEPGSRVRVRGIATSARRVTEGIFPFTVIADRVELVSPPPWWSPWHIAWLVLAAFALLLGLQWLLHRLQRWHLGSVLREREQLAFEMHDTLAQSFTGIAHQLHAAQVERSGDGAVRTHIAHALEMVNMSRREAGRTIAALRPQHRDAIGILAALKQIAERMGADSHLRVITSLDGRSASLPLHAADTFFRIGQEAISNALHHGRCSTLHIDLRINRRTAILCIRDDGAGFDPAACSAGMGIAGMKRRCRKVKASFALVSKPGEGTTVTATCPIGFAGAWFDTLRTRLARNFLPGSAA